MKSNRHSYRQFLRFIIKVILALVATVVFIAVAMVLVKSITYLMLHGS